MDKDKNQLDIDFKECLAIFMNEYWGERCSEHEDGCPTCNAWDNFDIMMEKLENPDSVYTYRTKALERYDLKELERMSVLGWNAFAATYVSDTMSNINTIFYFRKKL